MLTKYQSFSMKRVKRSEIATLPGNPRIIDRHAKKLLSENLKKNGLIFPLTLNVRTGHLISGHQRLNDLDTKEGYPKNGDFEIDIATIDVDEKKERELAVFVNNANSQGNWDTDLLNQLLHEDGIVLENTGFTPTDLDILLESADLGIGDASAGRVTQADVDQTILAQQAAAAAAANPPVRKEITQEEREKLREVKAAIKAQPENDTSFWLTIVFKNDDRRKEFLDRLHLPQVEQYISGETMWDVCFGDKES